MERKYWIVNKDLQCLAESEEGMYWENDITKAAKYCFSKATQLLKTFSIINTESKIVTIAHIVEAKELTYENVVECLKLLLRVGVCLKYVIKDKKVKVIEVMGDEEPTYWKNMKALSKFLIPRILERIESSCIEHTIGGKVNLYLETGDIHVDYVDLEGENGEFRFLG